MGGAEDLPKRASSPLKRPASDLEPEESSQNDVDMINVPSSDPLSNPPAFSTRSRVALPDNNNVLEPENGKRSLVENDTLESEKSKEVSGDSSIRPKSPTSEVPPIDTQIITVTNLIKANAESPLLEEAKVFLVSRRWMARVLARGSEARQNSKVEPEGEVGPIDNSDIIQQISKDCDKIDFVQLKHGVGIDDFELFPEDAWNMILEWYGLMPGTLPIERFAHNTNPDKNGLPNVIYEFHPPVFTIHRLFSDSCPAPIPQLLKVSNPTAPVIVASRSSKYHDLLKRAKEQTSIPLNRKVRVWRVPRLQPAAETTVPVTNDATPPSSRPGSPNPPSNGEAVPRGPQDSWKQVLLDVTSFTQLEQGNGRELVDRPDSTINANYNGHSDLSMAGLGEDQTLVLDENISGDSYVANYVKSSKSGHSTALTRTTGTTSQPASGRNSPAPSGPVTRGRAQKSSNGRMKGTVGLSNLGNTCYMNSALQCVRSVEELTKYFLSGAAYEELNTENILGNNGEVAVAYAKLLEEIYRDQTPTSVSPRNFKMTIGKFAPSFSGYGQQDSQEFLGFLLDGLQEDLSRVKRKPYIEKPDSTDEMVDDPEAIKKMAAQVWDITKKRDDSVIADLFTGMYKSTLVCPECAKVSITFDPYNAVTLQLPIENTWTHRVTYFPLNDHPTFIQVDLHKQGTFQALKEFVSSRVGVPPERLFVCEEFKSKIYKAYDDHAIASEDVGNSDAVNVYELESKPTNWPVARKPGRKKASLYNNHDSDDDIPHWDDPLADTLAERMLVTVVHRRPNPEQRRFSKAWILPLSPHCIVVTREEARNEEAIKRKILEKVATFSTYSEFDEDEEGVDSVTESVDPDIVITNGSDADSSGGSKVVAHSVDGEDELVDVSRETADSALPKVEDTQATKPSKFNSRRPKFVDPSTYLNPALQNMFTLNYLTSKEMVPAGWNTVDEDKQYPTLASRKPQLQQQSDHSSNGYGTNGHEGSESSGDDSGYQENSSTTRMAEESDEDEPSPRRALPVRPAAPRSGVRVGYGKGRTRRQKTYSKKGQKHNQRKFRESDDTEDTDQDAPDDGPLIRLGEAIVVDWNADAWEALYCGQGPEDMRGQDTLSSMTTLDDPELNAKRTARGLRRKNGITLDDCLDEFGKEEILSNDDQWYCPRCKKHQRASKKLELWKTPDILVMHLKRFSSSAMRRDKLDVLVDFPMEGLDLTSRVLETADGKSEVYDLFAVDDHWGGLGGGHYTAFAKNYIDHEWYEYNDSSVSKVKDPSRVVSQSAYLLFYRRRSDAPLGGPRFQQLVHDFDNPREKQPASEDEASESGEGQGLVVNSSLRGSSSPLTGVGAAHHHQQSHGLGKSNGTTVNPSDLDKLPAYDDSMDFSPEGPSGLDDVMLNDRLHASIEEDEGYVDNNYRSITQQRWDFSALDIDHMNRNNRISGTGSEIDAASDLVQDNSSASEGSRQGRIEDFDNAIVSDDYVEENHVPDLDEDAQANAIALQHDILDSRSSGMYGRSYAVPAADDMDVEEPATEIHIEEGDEFKMD